MKVIEIFINDDETTSQVTCPYCDISKTLPSAQLRALNQALRAKCSCDNVFELVVNRRRFPRKEDIRFEGELCVQGSQESVAEIVVISLSVGGVGFLIDGVSPQVGDVYTMSFILDDDLKTEVQEDIIVRHVRGDMVGAEFTGQGCYNSDLDFYLMPSDPDCQL